MTTAGDKPTGAPRKRRDGRVRFRVVSSEDGLMLRQLLCRRFAELKPQDAADLVKAGGVYINNVRIRLPSVRVAAGERLTVYRAAANTVHLDPKDLRILHRDPDFVIIDKPAGVPPSSTRASARGTVAQALVHRLSDEGILRPYVGPVRPIPTGASGLILYTARGQDAVSRQALYLDAELETTDLLLAEGDVPATMRCDAPILLNRSGRLTVCSPGAFGATEASTEFRRLDRAGAPESEASPGPRMSLVEARALRAAGAQAAVHAAKLGFPVRRQPDTEAETQADSETQTQAQSQNQTEAASPGRPSEPDAPPSGALFLHRARIRLVHPRTGEPLVFDAPPPPWART